jgi:hypothetical protein
MDPALWSKLPEVIVEKIIEYLLLSLKTPPNNSQHTWSDYLAATFTPNATNHSEDDRAWFNFRSKYSYNIRTATPMLVFTVDDDDPTIPEALPRGVLPGWKILAKVLIVRSDMVFEDSVLTSVIVIRSSGRRELWYMKEHADSDSRFTVSRNPGEVFGGAAVHIRILPFCVDVLYGKCGAMGGCLWQRFRGLDARFEPRMEGMNSEIVIRRSTLIRDDVKENQKP